jgi:excisionase family DNA binding protein
VSVTVTVEMNGTPVPLVLTDDALAIIAAAISPTDTARQEWLNVDSAAAYMDVSAERVRKLIARRAIAYSQEGPGCRVLLNRRDLDAYLIDHRHERRST